jgi:TonB family protein
MRSRSVLALVLSSLGVDGVSPAAGQEPVPTTFVPLNRWVASKSARGIRADGPLIEIGRGSGWIFSSALFEDFTLDLEFRILETSTSASLYVRAQPGERPSDDVYQINLSDSVVGSAAAGLIVRRSAARSPVGGVDVVQTAARPLGEWQRLEVACDGSLLQVSLNGTPVAKADGVLPAAGVVGLAGRSGRLELRNLRVLERNIERTDPISADPDRRIFTAGKGVAHPKLTKEVKPNYTPGAMARRVQGTVWMTALVLPDGTVGAVRVTKPLDRELDREAMGTVKQWRFAPALKDGAPVSVVIDVEMSFTLR